MDAGMGLVNILCIVLSVTWISECNGVRPVLLFANHRDVQLVEVVNTQSQLQVFNSSVIIKDLNDAAAVDFVYREGVIFWSDVTQEVIKRVNIDNLKHPKTVADTGLKSPDGLAVDWIGQKLYWTDSVTSRIEVSNLDGSFRKVLFWQRLDQPRAIVLDPQNGYMYWTDWGEVPKIEKAGMDGREETRSILIDENIHWPNGLTIDYDDSKIYWADAKLRIIHSCDFDGKNRRAIVEAEGDKKKLPHPFALTLYGDFLYWTDWVTHSIHGCDKRTGMETFVVMDDLFSPMDIHAFMASRQPEGQNMCGQNNGGCSHLCLLSPIDPYYTCACPTGIRLLNDNRTCANAAEKILFLARRQDIRQISLDMPDYTDLVLPLKRVQHAVALDYDVSSGFLYWTDDEVMAIQRAQLDGSEQEIVVEQEVSHSDGIAIDWIAHNLYWTDTGTNRIEVARLNGTSRKVIISDQLDEPRAICLDPAAGYMYWSDWSKKRPAIERAYLDGSQREVIVEKDLVWPNGLAIDLVDRRLFWGDADTDKIEVCDLDGRNRKTLMSEKLPHIFGFSLLGDYIYWTDWQTRSIERISKYTGGNRTFIIDGLPDLMGLKAVGLRNNKGTNSCGLTNGNCSHLCLYRPLPKMHVCACPMGLELQEDQHTCIIPEAFLVYSSRSDIRRLSLETKTTSQNNVPIPIQGVQKAMAIDFDINDNRIYWTDVELKQISRAFMNGSSLQHIIQFGLRHPEGMAVDWVAHNIYWADTGKNRIEVARLDGSSRKVLVWRDLEEPRALAVDPPQGYMYWAVWGKNKSLERANLDGTSRKVILSGLGRVQDLTIDYVDRRLYWADISDHSIKSADMNGKGLRTVVQSQVQHPVGLSQYEDFVYWTDIERQTIERANKTDGSNRTLIQGKVGPVMDILVFHTSRQAGGNACGKNNGDCSHLCIAHPVDETKNQTLTRHCACPTHYTLNKDGLTCTAPKNYLLLSTRNATIRLVIDSDNAVDNPEVVLPINNMKNVRALAYDPVGEFIYWVEKRQKIKRAHDNGTRASVVINGPDMAFQPYDIAIDPYARTLYWTCSLNNVINVTRIDVLNDVHRKPGVVSTPIGVIMASRKRFKPRSIVLYPEKGIMFYTNMLNSPLIEKALMDGSAPIVILKNGLVHPQSLTIDKRENKLYWADSQLNRIDMSDLSGGNRVVLVDGIMGNPKGLAVYGKFLYWLDKEQNLVERVHKKSKHKRLWVRGRNPDTAGLSDLIAVAHSVSAKWHPCYNHTKSGCSHICIITENRKSSQCSCPVGLQLKSDKKTCAEPPTCNSDQFKCANGHCIPMVWRCDYNAECEDGSDEDNCEVCKPTEFKCANNKCIPKELRCDQRKDCLDGADERNCCQGVNCSKAGSHQAGATDGPSTKSDGKSGSKSSKDYTIAIVVVLVFMLVVVILVLVCRRKSNNNGNTNTSTGNNLGDDIVMVMKKHNSTSGGGLGTGSDDLSPGNTLSRGKSVASGVSMESGGCPPYYDRSHVTGASSSSSAVTQYPKETLNPPPSPVTDRSLYKALSGNVYVSLNSLSTFQRTPGPTTSRGRRRHRRHHHHHHHHHHNIPPPPTTPCSTDVCEDSEPYHQYQQLVNPIHTSTPATHKHSGRSSKSRRSNKAKKLKHGLQDDSVIRLNYDSDPYPPPPTPRSHYFSDDMSCPPSPSTERSSFNPYPPPPSPVATSDC